MEFEVLSVSTRKASSSDLEFINVAYTKERKASEVDDIIVHGTKSTIERTPEHCSQTTFYINNEKHCIDISTIIQTSNEEKQNGKCSYNSPVSNETFEETQEEFFAFAIEYFNQKKYEECQRVLEKLLPYATGVLLLRVKINIIRCRLRREDITDVTQLIDQLVSGTSLSHRMRVIDELRLLSRNLSRFDLSGLGVKILRYCVESTECIDDPNNRMFELVEVAGAMQHVSDGTDHSYSHPKATNQIFELFGDIYRRVENITDVDDKFKARQVVWCLKYFGYCCNQLGSYTKSIQIHKQAIEAMRKAFGNDAQLYNVLGICHNNLGSAYRRLMEYKHAKTSFETALKVYESALDWGNDESKKDCISSCKKRLQSLS